MKLSKFIGLTGRKRSGKDTAGQVFQQLGYQRLAFADPIKAMVRVLLIYQGADEQLCFRMLEGDLKEEPSPLLGGRSPRYALQTLGTQWGRQLMADSFWVDLLLRAATQHQAVVVTDVRFPNEVVALKGAGASIYRIEREGVDKADSHESEAQIDDLQVDSTLVNAAPTARVFQEQVYRTAVALAGVVA